MFNNRAKWHGLERLLLGLKQYYEDRNLFFEVIVHIVGNIDDSGKIVYNFGLNKKVNFHGFKKGKELDEIFNICHIGVGSLGLHKINFEYGSPIKVREYLARGLPCVVSYKDEDIEDSCEFVLRILGDYSPVDIKKIIDFVTNLQKKYKDNLPKEIRNYALRKIDYRKKVDNLLNFLEHLYNK